jgi:flavin reductase (DIM6/NTAB) family NADH-FMN oxidoreductase RutF
VKEKTNLAFDKHNWHPSPLAGQIVLITTTNEDGTSNIAPKSWITMCAFSPPMLAMGCNRHHWTARNILERNEFVVNVPGAELAETVWKCSTLPHPRPVEAAGLTPIPAIKLKPPRIDECKAHLECRLDKHLEFGDELLLTGRILAVSIDTAAIDHDDPYSYLRLFAYLEGELYGVVERAEGAGGRRTPA